MNLEIANRLAMLRRQNNLSQEELADRLGISRQAISKWEQAKSSPDTDNLIRLARLYNVSLDDLLKTDEDLPPPEPVRQEEWEEHREEHPEDREEDGYSADYMERKRRYKFWVSFPYPVVMAFAYLALGFFARLWHPGWMLFLTIPLYYWLVNAMKPHKRW